MTAHRFKIIRQNTLLYQLYINICSLSPPISPKPTKKISPPTPNHRCSIKLSDLPKKIKLYKLRSIAYIMNSNLSQHLNKNIRESIESLSNSKYLNRRAIKRWSIFRRKRIVGEGGLQEALSKFNNRRHFRRLRIPILSQKTFSIMSNMIWQK